MQSKIMVYPFMHKFLTIKLTASCGHEIQRNPRKHPKTAGDRSSGFAEQRAVRLVFEMSWGGRQDKVFQRWAEHWKRTAFWSAMGKLLRASCNKNNYLFIDLCTWQILVLEKSWILREMRVAIPQPVLWAMADGKSLQRNPVTTMNLKWHGLHKSQR